METYKQRLDRLGREAWSNAKEALRNLGGKFLLPRPVDLLTRNQHDWNTAVLDARKVCLSGDTLLILSSQDLSPENINWDDVKPSEVWSEDGDWDASWSGLMDIFDQITQAEPKPTRKLYTVDVHYDVVLTITGIKAESEEEALRIASEKASSMSLNEGTIRGENSYVTEMSLTRSDTTQSN